MIDTGSFKWHSPSSKKTKIGIGRILGASAVIALALGAGFFIALRVATRGVSGDEAELALRRGTLVRKASEAVVLPSSEALGSVLALGQNGRLAGIPVSLSAEGETKVLVRSARRQIRNAVSAVELAGALHGVRFFEEPNLFRTEAPSGRKLTLNVEGFIASDLMGLIARCVGWPLVQDSTVHGTVSVQLEDESWDVGVQRILESLDLVLTRRGSLWHLSSRRRAEELANGDLTVVFFRPQRVSVSGAAKALEAARSHEGVAAPNTRLGVVVVADLRSVFPAYTRALAAVDREAVRVEPPPARATRSSPASFHARSRVVRDFFSAFSHATGVKVTVDPSVKGTLSLDLEGVSWEEALDVVCRILDLSWEPGGDSLLVASELGRLGQVGTEMVSIEKDGPEFFRPLKRCLSPAGSLTIDPASKTIVVRDFKRRAREIAQIVARVDRAAKDLGSAKAPRRSLGPAVLR